MTRIMNEIEIRNVDRLKARRNHLKAQALQKAVDTVKSVTPLE